MATERLAKWAVDLSYSSLPDEVVQAAVRSFYNWAGCAIGGLSHPTTTIARHALAPFFGKPTSSILGDNGDENRTDASHAALINGIASHVHDYDDTHLETIIHPTGPVASALLAQSEAHGSVKTEDFILALVAGMEAECKVGLGVWPKHYDIGWHITSTTGSIGAAVAVGKLLKLQKESMQHAIGIASTQVTGLREMFGSDTKSFHVGRAAQNGLMAAILASKGYTASLQSLEAKRGWINVVSASNSMDEQISSLGQVWEIAKNAFKPFPCGIVVHPVIDACSQLHRDIVDRGLVASDIRSVHARVHPLVLELTGKKTPQDGLQAKFSVYHGGAIGLVLGKAGPAQYDDKVVLDDKITTIRDKITATANQSLGADEAEIIVEMRDGTKLTKHVRHAIGSLEVPMNNTQLEEKFIDQVSLVLGKEGAEKASKTCWAIQDFNTVTELVQRL
ncbi:putative family protein [Phaeomoniella chlamydospora]|uniref:Putative family protein n=1 Tax=Phaeomoniella chlamydospora TaxID=158046 RepID=A0A0G2FQB5_PHACM|nr:putative family protein [Phaeomoniella chlamydospora]